jgi:hypothetical protein
LRLLGRGRPMESYVLRPITMGWPVVVRLKKARSAGKCQGRVPPRPMIPDGVMATMPMRFCVAWGTGRGCWLCKDVEV